MKDALQNKLIRMSKGEVKGGQLIETEVVMVKQSMFLGCPFCIIDLSHYRLDGTCKCDDAGERVRMKAWGYTKKDFKNIPLRERV